MVRRPPVLASPPAVYVLDQASESGSRSTVTVRSRDEKNFSQHEISRIRKAFGAPAVSYGVLHEGQIVLAAGDGFANVEKELPADADTVYCIASCSKAFVTATIAELAAEKKVSWDRPVSEYLPEFCTGSDPEVSRRATLLDLCSHGTGLAPLDHVALGFHDKCLNSGKEQVRIASSLPVVYDLRSRFLYNNFMLGVAGDVISRVTGKSTGEAIQEHIMRPLGLNRTGTDASQYPDNNVAQGYAVLDNGNLLPLEEPDIGNGTLTGAAGFVRSCVNDMLQWAKSAMLAEQRDSCVKTTDSNTPGPLRGFGYTRCARRPIVDKPGSGENSYALGWFRHMIPSEFLSSIGPNFALLPDPPVMGAKEGQRLTIAHWGEFGGYLTSFYTFPGTCSAVIVMGNCTPSRGDPTDLIAQSLCQDLFGMTPRVDFGDHAHRAARASAQIWPSLTKEWSTRRIADTPSSTLADLVGRYENSGFKISIEIRELCPKDRGEGCNPELLSLTINNLRTQTAKLRHYHFDVWTFLPDSRDDAVRKGMEGFMTLSMLLLSFKRDLSGKVCALDWDLQAGACEGPAPGIERLVAPVCFAKVDC